MTFEGSARDGVDLLRILIETAQFAYERGRGAELCDVLAQALGVLAGDCAPHLTVRPALDPVSWFTVTDRGETMVVERNPGRTHPYYVIARGCDPGRARLLVDLLTENERHTRPRLTRRLREAS